MIALFMMSFLVMMQRKDAFQKKEMVKDLLVKY